MRTLAVMSLILLVLACHPPMYVRSAANSPMFTKAGEIQTTTQYGIYDFLGGKLDIQNATSFTNHIGIIANYSSVNKKGIESTRHWLSEAGVGYYSNHNSTCFEIFAGAGKGRGKNGMLQDDVPTEKIGDYNLYFIQPAFGFNKKNSHISFVSRLSLVDFKSISDGNGSTNLKPSLVLEPAIVNKINLFKKRAYFSNQIGFSMSLQSDDFRQSFFHISVGLGARVNVPSLKLKRGKALKDLPEIKQPEPEKDGN